MIKENFKPYFDENTPEKIVARVFQEERKGVEIRKRVVHAERYSKNRIDTDGWGYNRHSPAEKTATATVFKLIESGFDMAIWISPKSDIYPEGRLNVMLPIKERGELLFDPWGMTLPWEEKETLELGWRLSRKGGVPMDPIENVESLRRQPLGFKLKTGERWIDKCRELVPELIGIWDDIEQGIVDKNMELIAEKVREARRVGGNDNVKVELEMAKMGYRLNFAGDHGGSWLSTLADKGIYNFKIKRIGGLFYTEAVKVDGKTICPVCGVEIGEGRSSCPKCGVKLKSGLN